MTPFDIYLIFTAGNLSNLFGVVGLIGSFIAILILMFGFLEKEPAALRVGRILIVTGPILGILGVLLPSTKTLVAMYVVPAVVNSEYTEKLGTKAINVLDSLMSEYLASVKKETK